MYNFYFLLQLWQITTLSECSLHMFALQIKAMLFLFPVKAVGAHMTYFSGSTACTGGGPGTFTG